MKLVMNEESGLLDVERFADLPGNEEIYAKLQRTDSLPGLDKGNGAHRRMHYKWMEVDG